MEISFWAPEIQWTCCSFLCPRLLAWSNPTLSGNFSEKVSFLCKIIPPNPLPCQWELKFKNSRIAQLTNEKRNWKRLRWRWVYRTCKAYLNIRIISWRPSPFRKRSLLALYINEEHRQLKRFSMNSNSSEVVGSYRLYSCNGIKKYWLGATGTYKTNLHEQYFHLVILLMIDRWHQELINLWKWIQLCIFPKLLKDTYVLIDSSVSCTKTIRKLLSFPFTLITVKRNLKLPSYC